MPLAKARGQVQRLTFGSPFYNTFAGFLSSVRSYLDFIH